MHPAWIRSTADAINDKHEVFANKWQDPISHVFFSYPHSAVLGHAK